MPKVIEALSGEPVQMVAAGRIHSLVLTRAGTVLSFGAGDHSRLGHGFEQNHHTPKVIEALRGERVVAVSAGGDHSLVLTEVGTVFSFGSGAHGRLGHGNTHHQRTPTVIEALRGERVVAASAGSDHCLVVTEAGAALSFGHGGYGCLGHGNMQHQLFPKVIEALRGERVVAASAGNTYSLVLTEAGAVLSFGSGMYGSLGHGTMHKQLTPKVIETLRGRRVREVAAGESHSVCVLECGRVFGWGFGKDETLGLGLQLGSHQLTPREYPSLRL